MNSTALFVVPTEGPRSCELADAGAQFADAPRRRSRAARGALTGMVLGAGLWGTILVLVGVIKL